MEIVKDSELLKKIKEIFGNEAYKNKKFNLNEAANLVSRSTAVLLWDLKRNYLKSTRNEKNRHIIVGEELVEWYSVRPDFRTSIGKSFRNRIDSADYHDQAYQIDKEDTDRSVISYAIHRVKEDAANRLMTLVELSLLLTAAVLTYCFTIERAIGKVRTTVSYSFRRLRGNESDTKAFVIT